MIPIIVAFTLTILLPSCENAHVPTKLISNPKKVLVGCDIYPNYNGGFYRNISTMGLAAIDDDVEMLKMLLEAGCDPNYNETSALFFDVMDYLDYDNYEYIYDEDYYNYADYEMAYYYGDWEYEDDGRYIGGVAVLHIASVEGSIDVVKQLIKHGEVDVNVQDEFGMTPMYDAASWGYYDIIEILAKAGADPDIATVYGATPVHAAASYGYTDTVKALADVGADLNKKGGLDDDTPLIVAAYYGYRDVVKLLLEQGVDVNARDSLGKTALYWARWANYRKIAKLLRSYGATL